MPYPYTPPAHLQGQSVDAIHKRMLDSLPADIDKSEMQIPWDFTRPAAIEKAEFIGFELCETIKIMFSQWAYAEWLDMHAESEGLARRPPNKATGTLLIKGEPGFTVPAGFLFATPATSGNAAAASVIFEADEAVTLNDIDPTDGQAYSMVPVTAIAGGRAGNVPPGTIVLSFRPPAGGEISYVSNPEATTGGAEGETDDELREQIQNAKQRGASYTGCDADYERWAGDVPGIGNVVVDPEWDDPSLPEVFHWTDGQGRRRCAGAVRLFVVDANGAPANGQILNAVHEHIIGTSDRGKRLAPIGASLTVTAPTPVYIDIDAVITLKDGATLENAIEGFRAKLDEYWLRAATENDPYETQPGGGDNYVKYVYIGSALAESPGVANYGHASLKVNGGTADILITLGTYPVTRAVNLIVQT